MPTLKDLTILRAEQPGVYDTFHVPLWAFYQGKANKWLKVVYGYYIAAKLLSEMQTSSH